MLAMLAIAIRALVVILVLFFYKTSYRQMQVKYKLHHRNAFESVVPIHSRSHTVWYTNEFSSKTSMELYLYIVFVFQQQMSIQ